VTSSMSTWRKPLVRNATAATPWACRVPGMGPVRCPG
jgi:hypothetical protein